MKLKELIPLLYNEDTSSKNQTVRIELWENTGSRFVYEGVISDFYTEYIAKPAYSTFYKNVLCKFGEPIGEFSVQEFTHYSDGNTNPNHDDIPVYNRPINIVIY